MKKQFLSILFFSISTLQLFAQTEATTNDGKKIILNDNGTWKYKETIQQKTNETTNSTDNCNKYIITIEDKVTGKSTTSSKNNLIVSKDGGKKGFGIFCLKLGEESIGMSIQVVGAGGCLDDDEKMNILFRDGTRLELTNDGKFNCDSKYTQYFGGYSGKNKELELFITKEIETMRIWTSKGYVEENFTSEESQELMKTLNCLSHLLK